MLLMGKKKGLCHAWGNECWWMSDSCCCGHLAYLGESAVFVSAKSVPFLSKAAPPPFLLHSCFVFIRCCQFLAHCFFFVTISFASMKASFLLSLCYGPFWISVLWSTFREPSVVCHGMPIKTHLSCMLWFTLCLCPICHLHHSFVFTKAGL